MDRVGSGWFYSAPSRTELIRGDYTVVQVSLFAALTRQF